nr:TauD/TfdA family dioxygenase [Photorhabdus cinerea]
MTERKDSLPAVDLFLSNQDKNKLSQALNTISNRYTQELAPHQLADEAAKKIIQNIDSCLLSKIVEYWRTKKPPYLLFKNFISTYNLPPTPTNDITPEESGWRTQAAALLGLLKLTGYACASFQDEMGGRLCHMVMPAENSEKSFLRSTKKLNFHTEVVNGYFKEEKPDIGDPLSPESLGLICLRNPDKIPTTILSLKNILKQLPQNIIQTLMDKNYYAQSQSSFDRQIIIDNVSVLIQLSNGSIGIRYSNSKLIGKTAIAQNALDTLHKLLNDSPDTLFLTLSPGDALIINNRNCLHGRSAISDSAKFNGNDRWLVRIYGYTEETIPFMKKKENMEHVMLLNR